MKRWSKLSFTLLTIEHFVPILLYYDFMHFPRFSLLEVPTTRMAVLESASGEMQLQGLSA
jgi:hypothetical protein